MVATHSLNSTASSAPVLYVAFELSSGQWKLASTTARGQRARVVSVQARNIASVLREIARAKARFGVAESAVVFSCYEAGRDGLWLHRCLHHHGICPGITDTDDPRGLWACSKESNTHRGTSGRPRYVPMPATSRNSRKK